ncbi:cupin domain-containing protein [Acidovorax sp. A79]|uniref:cupin domain-containing protein n=1 Tax=Acidovorax sp. A79 TaxID=3056107 RepID=UPI0034E84CA7
MLFIKTITQSAAAVDGLQDRGIVAVPLSTPASAVRGLAVQVPGRPDCDTGLWECSRGRFQRQVPSGEIMHIVAGAGRFLPEGEGMSVVEFRAGDTLFFPPETRGVREIRETIRKLYVMV